VETGVTLLWRSIGLQKKIKKGKTTENSRVERSEALHGIKSGETRLSILREAGPYQKKRGKKEEKKNRVCNDSTQ